MTFTLLFLIVLSLILLVGAYLIWKSDLSDNDKIISIIAILGLFSLVSIVNEAKKTSYNDVKYSLVEFEKSFFSQKVLHTELEYKLPILNDIEDWIQSCLEENQIYDPNSFTFGLIIGEPKNGKSLAFQEYTKILQGKTIPALYIDIKDPDSNIFNLLTYLKIANLNLLEEAIDHLNEAGKTPVIIIDNIHNAFSTSSREYETSGCPICEYLKILYDSKRMNILMVTNRFDIIPKITSNEAYTLRLHVMYMKPRKNDHIAGYLLDRINDDIQDQNHKFTQENINVMLKSTGFSWDQLNEYIQNYQKYRDVEDFTYRWLKEKGYKYISNEDVRKVIDIMLNIIKNKNTDTYNNDQWVSYSQIKKYILKDLASKIEEALRTRTIVIDKAQYRFTSEYVLNAILVASDKKNFDEL